MQFFCFLLLFFFLSLIGILFFWESRHKDLTFPNVISKEKIATLSKKKRKKSERTDRKDLYYPPLYPSEPINESKNVPPKIPSIPNDPIDFPALIRIKRNLKRPEEEVDGIEMPIISLLINKENPETRDKKDIGTNTELIETQDKGVNTKPIKKKDFCVNIIPETAEISINTVKEIIEKKDIGTNTERVETAEIGTDPDRERIPSIELPMFGFGHHGENMSNPSQNTIKNYLEHGQTINTEYIPFSNVPSKTSIPSKTSLSSDKEKMIILPETSLKKIENEPVYNLVIQEESTQKPSILKERNESFEILEESFKPMIKSIDLGEYALPETNENEYSIIENKNIKSLSSLEEEKKDLP